MSTFYKDYYAYAPSDGNTYGDYSPQQNTDIVGLIADNDRYLFYTWKARTTLYISMSEGTADNFPDALCSGPISGHSTLSAE